MKKLTIKKSTLTTIITIAAIIVMYFIMNGMSNAGSLSNKVSGMLIPICVWSIMAVSLNLVVGILGELSLGHAGFMSIGAYSGALVTNALELPAPVELLIGLAVGGIMAYNSGNYATLTDISNTGNITVCNTLETGASSWVSVGGITGYDGQEPPMTRCTNSGDITVTGYYDHSTTSTPLRVGGIVGYVASFAKLRAGAINSGNITIGAKDAVTKTDVLMVGGIWGQNTSASATMTDPINVGNIEVTNVENSELEASHIGGIVGKTYANVTNAQCYCNIYAQDYPKSFG